jgi:hypothetical protein
MFYKKEDVDSALICPFCSEILRDPRLLPCGSSACHECIQNRSDNEYQVDCLACKNKHAPIDKVNGFYPNNIVLKLIESKASDVYRGKQVESLKQKLAEIKKTSHDLLTSLNNGVDGIQEYCLNLKNQVHLQTEIHIQSVHELSDKLIAQIAKYEKECIDSFSQEIKARENEFGQFLSRLDGFYTECSRFLDEFMIDESKVEDSLKLANDHIREINKAHVSLEKIKFCGKMMEFEKSETELETDLLGSLVYNNSRFEISHLERVHLSETELWHKHIGVSYIHR